MKLYLTALSFFLYTLTFNISAKNICDTHSLPERTQSFFLYGIDIDQNQLNHQIIKSCSYHIFFEIHHFL